MKQTGVIDPLKFTAICWPDIVLTREQEDILLSLRDNDETYVVAGNMLGKDFVSSISVLWFFSTRHPCRIVTTSAKDEHLDVLWGEIGQRIQTSRDASIQNWRVTHHRIERKWNGLDDKLSYVKGMVASKDTESSLGGHHIAEREDGVPLTLFVADEASSVPDFYFPIVSKWHHRSLVIGNAWECNNRFKRAFEGQPGTRDQGGDILRKDGAGFLRKTFRLRADSSPNIRLALKEQSLGLPPSNRILVPGVKSWGRYEREIQMFDDWEICVSHNAEWYKGDQLLLFPEWMLKASHEHAVNHYRNRRVRRAKAMGVDPAAGGDNSSWAIVDEWGLIELISKKTKDTSEIPTDTLALMRKHQLQPNQILFDIGGLGKPIVDHMRAAGFMVRGINFGDPATPDPKRGITIFEQKKREKETKSVYKDKRSEMYGILRNLLDKLSGREFGIPIYSIRETDEHHSEVLFKANDAIGELNRQLRGIPYWRGDEGRLELASKNLPTAVKETTTKVSLSDILGCSPDEADALVLAVYGMEHKPYRPTAGVGF